jgi:ribosome-binding protein aMBF1 (putative translation factor)
MAARKTMGQKKAELMHNPEFAAAYGALEEEFALAEAIIRARMAAGMTQEEVAKVMHTTQSSIARLESGKAMPGVGTLQKIARATRTRLVISFQAQ